MPDGKPPVNTSDKTTALGSSSARRAIRSPPDRVVPSGSTKLMTPATGANSGMTIFMTSTSAYAWLCSTWVPDVTRCLTSFPGDEATKRVGSASLARRQVSVFTMRRVPSVSSSTWTTWLSPSTYVTCIIGWEHIGWHILYGCHITLYICYIGIYSFHI